MLSKQGNKTVRRSRRCRVARIQDAGVRIGIIVLLCSLVAIDAFGQPQSKRSSSGTERAACEVIPHDPTRAPDIEDAHAMWCGWVHYSIDQVRRSHGFMRGLNIPDEVTVALRTQDEVRDYLESMLDASMRQTLSDQEYIFRTLGVFEEASSYESVLLTLLQQEISGYYEPEDQAFYVVEDKASGLDRSVVIHELQHVVQDQEWGLSEMLRPDWRQSDLLAARSALVEGDAMLTHFSWEHRGNPTYAVTSFFEAMRAQMEKINHETTSKYPRFVLDQLTLPYLEGMQFVRDLYAYEQWFSVNEAFLAPPQSTAEILDVQRYLQGFQPTLLHYDLPSTTAKDRVYSDVWGVMTMQHILAAMIAPDRILTDEEHHQIRAATRGWIGDRIEVWNHRKGRRIVWLSAFEGEDDAKGFFELFKTSLSHRTSGPWTCANGAHGQHCGTVDAQSGTLIERWGDHVLWVWLDDRNASALEKELLQTADDVFRTLRHTRYPAEWQK